MSIKILNLIFYSVLITNTFFHYAIAKPFKRVLVISGGGLNPGTPLGIIHGVESMGWKPDLIISSCGSSAGSLIYNSSNTHEEHLNVLYDRGIYNSYHQISLTNSWFWDLSRIFGRANKRTIYPNIFSDLILHVPQNLPMQIQNSDFAIQPNRTKLIFIGSKSLFTPNQVGNVRPIVHPMFQSVFFTDLETSKYLSDIKNKPHHVYPYSNVVSDNKIETRFNTIDAFRASIADPYLLKPFKFENNYYFSGAVNLFSVDIALELGDEVVATYPKGFFNKYENAAIESTYGFYQNVRILESIQHDDVKWIDMDGADENSFNPQFGTIGLNFDIPNTRYGFNLILKKQYEFGISRAKEALSVPPYSQNHLRKPISKALLHDYTCKSAYAWKTPDSDYCENDFESGCNRNSARYCFPLR